MQLGERLLKARKKRGIIQQQLADHCGVSKQYISNIENGRKTNPINELLIKLGNFLDVSPSYFIDDDPSWYKQLPNELKKFVKEENIDYLRAGLKAKEHSISAEMLSSIIDAIIKNYERS